MEEKTKLTDTEILTWIASHLQSFHPSFGSAKIIWITKNGYTNVTSIEEDRHKISSLEGTSELELLKKCVYKAIEESKT